MTPETPEARKKRMSMRSWRRGLKEMDLILGPYADVHLEAMEGADLDLFDALLEENDQDLLPWVMGARPAPAAFAPLIARLASFARDRWQPATA